MGRKACPQLSLFQLRSIWWFVNPTFRSSLQPIWLPDLNYVDTYPVKHEHNWCQELRQSSILSAEKPLMHKTLGNLTLQQDTCVRNIKKLQKTASTALQLPTWLVSPSSNMTGLLAWMAPALHQSETAAIVKKQCWFLPSTALSVGFTITFPHSHHSSLSEVYGSSPSDAAVVQICLHVFYFWNLVHATFTSQNAAQYS